MNAAAIAHLTTAVHAAHRAAQTDLTNCDVGDIEELLVPIDRELKAPHPNKATLATFINSLARSLRSDPVARNVCLQLDEAMREAGIESNWEQV